MELQDAIPKLAALAQETRLAVFRLLIGAGHKGLAAGDIAAALDVPAPTLSFHLAQLTQAGLLERRRNSRSIIYTVDFEGVQSLFRYLAADCCEGRPELCGFDTKSCSSTAKKNRRTCRTKARN
ncbi:MAG: metalloregulator ArsR/SmtB family transcription factor [Pseudorhodoplanes sp.]|nr:metalloregulator ArsR/SmtB family transcription factor [Pseudorhodoplanes sp.]